MAIDETLIALVTAKQVEVYTRAHGRSYANCVQICRVALPYPVLDAPVSIIADKSKEQGDICVARLCLTTREQHHYWLSVVDVVVNGKPGEVVMHTIWTLRSDKREDTRPVFGTGPHSISWRTAQWTNTWSHLSFSTAILPLPSASPSSLNATSVAIYEVSGPHIPALHYMGVWDYDETVGVLVLANACGELRVCDISGQYSSGVESWLPRLSFLPAHGQSLPTVRLRSSCMYHTAESTHTGSRASPRCSSVSIQYARARPY